MYYINKIKQHLSNWWYFIKEHLVGICFFIILITFIILSIFKLEIVNTYEIKENGEQRSICPTNNIRCRYHN